MAISALLIDLGLDIQDNIKKVLELENIKVIITTKSKAIKIINDETIYIIIASCFGKETDLVDIIMASKIQDLYRPIIIIGDAKYKATYIQMGVHIYYTKKSDIQYLPTQILNLLTLYRGKKFAKSQFSILEALSLALEIRDPYTHGHGRRTSIYATMIYDAYGYKDAEDRETLRVGCLIHDIGKVGTPDTILKSNAKLTKEEFRTVAKHPLDGVNICKNIINNDKILDIVEHHHEKMDGSGYPHNLKGNKISKLTQIATISDIYDALTSDRSYHIKNIPKKALIMMDEFFFNKGKISPRYYKVLKFLVFEGKFDKIK